MAKNLYFTVSDPAWIKLRDLPEHKHRRKAYQQFTGFRYVTVEPPPPSAKGLANWLTNFMFKQRSPYHLPNPPYSILPESFVDTRDWALQDYEVYGMPGGGLNLTMENFGTIHSRRTPTYTVWNDGSNAHTHGIMAADPQGMCRLAQTIVEYWHISLPGGYFPRAGVECFSAFANALGMGYLSHPLLNPEPESISSNIYYRQIDARLEHMKEVAEKHKKKEQTGRRILCRNQTEIGAGEWLKCKEVSEYVLDFANQQTYLCSHCIAERTQHLPKEMYTIYTLEEFTNRPLPQGPKIKLVPLIGPAIPRTTPTISTNVDGTVVSSVDPSKVIYGKPVTGVPREHTEEERLILKDFQNKAKQHMIEGVANSLKDQAAFEERQRLEQLEADKAKRNKEWADSHKMK